MRFLSISLALILISVSQTGFSQEYLYGISFEHSKYPYSQWKPDVIAMANTCSNVGYMTEEEKKLVFLCNLARFNGKLFAETFYQDYFDSNRLKPNDFTTSLFADLRKSKKMPMLEPQKDLCNVAEEYAVKMGRSGKTGNKSYKSRYAKLNKLYGGIAENYVSGNSEAIKIVFDMLIDNNSPSKSNRRNILNKKVNATGLSIQPHSKHQYNTVMGFAVKK